MIEALNATKEFSGFKAVDDVTLTIRENEVFGMIGSNGAGKSTFLRMVAGVYRPEAGSVLVDGENVYENPEIKKNIFYISDDQYFINNYTPAELAKYYAIFYEKFDMKRALSMFESLDLGKDRKINTFSKGMKKQVSIICGICAGTKYLLCDETFDGLDPVVRQIVKSLFAKEMEERELTPIIASHNLRELEDICDHVGLLHKGGILLSKDIEEMRLNIFKLQAVFNDKAVAEEVISKYSIVKREERGKLITLTLRGQKDEIVDDFMKLDPLYIELLPLTLEEIFMCETEVAGYDIRKILF